MKNNEEPKVFLGIRTEKEFSNDVHAFSCKMLQTRSDTIRKALTVYMKMSDKERKKFEKKYC